MKAKKCKLCWQYYTKNEEHVCFEKPGKYLEAKELSKKIVEVGYLKNIDLYTFQGIPNPPTLEVEGEAIRKCSCKHHVIHANKTIREVKCRYIQAYDLYYADMILKNGINP